MNYSAVLIIPADLKPQADAVGEGMGWGPESYTIPLSHDEGETVTHFALRADVDAQFIRWIRGQDPLPDTSAEPILGALIADFSPDPDDDEKPILWGRAHLDAVLAEHGFVTI